MDFDCKFEMSAPKADKKVREQHSIDYGMFKSFPKKKHYRKAYSETMLNDMFGREEIEKGATYHCISNGDIDSLSYLRFMLRKQKAEKLVLSTWCMSVFDIRGIESWLGDGTLKTADLYVGEIFPKTYQREYFLLKRLQDEGKLTVKVFRNHSKIMAVKGSEYDFVIESSANVNTNPRAENTVLSIDEDLRKFYFDWFDKINSID